MILILLFCDLSFISYILNSWIENLISCKTSVYVVITFLSSTISMIFELKKTIRSFFVFLLRMKTIKTFFVFLLSQNFLRSGCWAPFDMYWCQSDFQNSLVQIDSNGLSNWLGTLWLRLTGWIWSNLCQKN